MHPINPVDTRIWNLFAAGAIAMSASACGTRALGSDTDGDGTDSSAESDSTSVGTVGTSTVGTTDGPECQTDADCEPWEYCRSGSCYYYIDCGFGDRAEDEDDTIKCQPPYECWADEDCGDGFICASYYCIPDPNPNEPIGPACDDDAALPVAQIPVPELEQVIDLAYGSDAIAMTGTTQGSDIARVVVRDVVGGTNAAIDLPSAFDPQHVAMGDLDGNGDDDVVTLDPFAGLLFVIDGKNQKIATYNLAGVTWVGIADLDPAATGEELYGIRNGEAVIWRGSKPAGLGTATPVSGLTPPISSLRAADIDQDGGPELLATTTDAAWAFDPVADQGWKLDDTLIGADGRRRLAGTGDPGDGQPLLLDAEAFDGATYLRRHRPILDGFGPVDADWPVPFTGSVSDLALVRLVSPTTTSAAVAIGGDVWVRLSIAADIDCWRMLESSPNGSIGSFAVGDADANGIEGLAFTDGVTVWVGGD